MRQIPSIIVVLLQCVSLSSFAASGQTTNNGGNLAEIRFTDAWKNLGKRFAPCLTPQNLCQLSRQQLRSLSSAIQTRNVRPMVLPGKRLLYHENGDAKSEAEIYGVVLGALQDCNFALEPETLTEIVTKANEISHFTPVKLNGGQNWFFFIQGKELFVEDAGGVKELSALFRDTLRLEAAAPILFHGLWAKNIAGMIELGGRVNYDRAGEKSGGFTILMSPTKEGLLPLRTSLTVFR